MPAGAAPLGFAYFVGVKFVGYTAAVSLVRRKYPNFVQNIWKVGAARTAIGIGIGVVYGWLWLLLRSQVVQPNPIPFFVALFPIRLGEWLLLVHLFFDRGLQDRGNAWEVALGGTIWSYCLDAIGVAAAFVIPGGFWIC